MKSFLLICLIASSSICLGEGKTHNGDLCIGPDLGWNDCPNGEWTGRKTNLNEFKDITKITGNLRIYVSSPNRSSFFFF